MVVVAYMLAWISIIPSYLAQRCYSPHQCSGQTFDDAYKAYLYAYRGAENIILNASLRIESHGAYASPGSKLYVKTNIGILGAFSTANSEVTSGSVLYVQGVFGAANSLLSAGDWVGCDGHSSCRNSQIFSTPEVYAHGAYTLANATITSDGDMNITFSAFRAGYKAKIICQQGDVCNVHCESIQACEELECVGSGCNVEHSCDVDASLGDRKTNLVEYDAMALWTSVEDLCNSNDARALDDYGWGGSDVPIDNTNNCCRGAHSCSSDPSISAPGKTLNCAAYLGCPAIVGVSVVETLTCGGRKTCMDTSFIASNVYCSGYSSCQRSSFIVSKFFECSGRYCGYETNITSPGNNAEVTIVFSAITQDTQVHCQQTDTCNIIILVEPINNTYVCDGDCLITNSTDICSAPLQTTSEPTGYPTRYQSENPSVYPTMLPTVYPTQLPTIYPTQLPTGYPTVNPTTVPTIYPTILPTAYPSRYPSGNPSVNPTSNPATLPTLYPSDNPTAYPTRVPTDNPTLYPTYNSVQYEDVSLQPSTSPIQALEEENQEEEAAETIVPEVGDTMFWMIIVIIVAMNLCICSVCFVCCACVYIRRKNKKMKTNVTNIAMELNTSPSASPVSPASPSTEPRHSELMYAQAAVPTKK